MSELVLYFLMLILHSVLSKNCSYEQPRSSDIAIYEFKIEEYTTADTVQRKHMENKLSESLHTHGFLHLNYKNFVDTNAFQALYDGAKKFFHREEEYKMLFYPNISFSKSRGAGYMPIGIQGHLLNVTSGEYSTDSNTIDYVEAFGIINLADDYLRRNPTTLPEELKPTFHEFTKAMKSLLIFFDQVASSALNMTSNPFESMNTRSFSSRINFYPKIEPEGTCSQVETFGLGPHTDILGFTLLFNDPISGLQVSINDEWVDVPWKPDCVLVNSADAITRYTNGFWKAPLHSVRQRLTSERISLVSFSGGDLESQLGPFDGCHVCNADKYVFPNDEGKTLREYVQGKLDAIARDDTL